MTNTHIIKTDAAYGAVNGWPEMRGDEVKLLSAILRDRPRMDGAACVGYDPDLWFADKGEYLKRAQAEEICAACPIRSVCTQAASVSNEPHGVWGGYSADESEPELDGECAAGHSLSEHGMVMRSRGGRKIRCTVCAPLPDPEKPSRPPRTHCGNGHEYTPENTRIEGRGRRCKTCHREAEARRRVAS